MFIYDEIFRMNAFSDNNIGRYDTILSIAPDLITHPLPMMEFSTVPSIRHPLETTEEVTLLPSKY